MTTLPPFTDSVLSLLPPVLAIGLAIATRRVILSLFVGVWLGWTLLADFNPLTGLGLAFSACLNVVLDVDNALVIAFSMLVGALIALTRYGGGVDAFVAWVTTRGLIQTPKRARLLSFFLGVVIFVESSITSLINGAVCRPIFDSFKISREKLAYLCDATAAPICILIPLNAWGAYVVTQLDKSGVDGGVSLLVASMPFNFYALGTLGLAFFVAWTGRDFRGMARAEARAASDAGQQGPDGVALDSDLLMTLKAPSNVRARVRTLLVPVGVMVGVMPLTLAWTGDGNILAGRGALSVFTAVVAGLLVAAFYTRSATGAGARTLGSLVVKGSVSLRSLALLMVLAFAIGVTTRELGTGLYVASLTESFVHPGLIPALIFVVSGCMAFSTGTSWGTFAIMLPLAVPMMAQVPGLEGACIAAVLGGGVFGDHCSPISDTTLIASIASGSDHISHVNTQLPYALSVAAGTTLLYVAVGLIGV